MKNSFQISQLPRAIVAFCVLVCGLSAQGAATEAVFQFSIPVAATKRQTQAFLWIPPEAKSLRGIVMAGMTLMERDCVKDPVIRKVCTDEQLAMVLLKCGLGDADVTKVLDDFAQVSGYRELSGLPMFFIGHSAGGPQAKDRAIQFADRCFGLVQYRGGVANGPQAVPSGIPALIMLGQFDEFGGTMRNQEGRETWEDGRDQLAAFRAANENHLASLVVEPGAGHFSWSERNATYLAHFLRSAAQTRLTPDGKVREISPTSGWLSELPSRNASQFAPASHAQYAGPRTHASWHFNEAMARATVAYHAGLTGKKDQFIRWTDAVAVEAGARFFFTNLQWVGDGQTFEVHPNYADRFPGLYDGKGPQWAETGKPVGHSDAPICVKPVGGPVIAVGTNRLRIKFDGLAPASEVGRVSFLASSVGNASYRHTEQVGMLPRKFGSFKASKNQRIEFAPMKNMKPDSPPVKLHATSDAGLPVEFYVAHGPAVVTNGSLRVTEVPARAKFPIEVKVVAWQFGRRIDPLVQSAAPVEQTFQIEKP